MVNLNHFYYFYMVAEIGSVTAASKVLRISQPALSKQVKHFESSLDTKLFEKHGRGLRLTPTGLSLFGQARSIFEKAEYLSKEFASTPTVVGEQVRIGLGAGIERSFATDLITEFLSLKQEGNRHSYFLSVSSIDYGYLNRYLKEHVIDACITERRLPSADFSMIASVSSPICLALPLRFARRLKNTKTKDLGAAVEALKLPWIVPTANLSFRYEVERILDKHAIDLQPTLESDSMMTIVRSVENGVGMALVPKHYLNAARSLKHIMVLDKLQGLPKESIGLWIRSADAGREFVIKLAGAFKKVTTNL